MKILCILLLAVCCLSCSKQPITPPSAIVLYTKGDKADFPTYSKTTQDFCEKKLVTINAGQLLISFVADSLVKGNYSAGLNLWGKYTDNISLTINNISTDKISGTFTGKVCNGVIN